MNTEQIKHLSTRIVIAALVFFALSPLFRSDETLAYNIGYSIIGGIVLGTVLYLLDRRKAHKRRR